MKSVQYFKAFHVYQYSGRDGTVLFDMFGREKNEDGTGRDGKIMKIVDAWMGRDGMVGVNFC